MDRGDYWYTSWRRRLGRRALLRRVSGAGAGLAGAYLLACGGDKKEEEALSTPATGEQPRAAATASGPAKRGGTLRISGQIAGDAPALDYFKVGSSIPGTVNNVAGSKLVQWNEAPDRGDTPVEQVLPDLATKWESADGLTYTFTLRPGVQFPNGREVTSEDVKWSMERNAAVGTLLPRTVPALFTGKQPNVQTPDKYTVVAKLNEQDADFLPIMGSHWWSVQTKDVMAQSADGWGEITKVEHIRGTGPYQPTEYVPASHFTFERNPKFYDTSLAYVDKIDHRLIAEPSAAAAALRAGQIDAFGPLTLVPINIARDLEKVPTLNVQWHPGMNYWHWHFDVDNPPFNDVRVRRALALAFDRETWIKELYFGRGSNTALIGPYLKYWTLNPKDMGADGKYYTTFDQKEAKSLLTAAGFPNGFSFDVQIANIASHAAAYPMVELAQSMVSEVGIKLNQKVVEYGAHLQSATPVGGVYSSWIVRPDIESFVYSIIHPKVAARGGNLLYKNLNEQDNEYKRAVDLMDRQRRTLDLAERRKVVHDLQRLWAQNLWTFYFPVPDSAIIANKSVQNFVPTPGWNAGVWKYVWLDQN